MAGVGITRFEQAALSLAERGYHVFPCASRGKKPLTRNGFKDSSRDQRQIRHWWDRIGDANVAVDCGATGIVVLDIDAKSGADPDQILDERDLHGAPVVLTGEAPERDQQHPHSLSGVRGAQVFFRGDLRTTNHLAIPGTEIRGAGGYVVVPPSVHPSGVEYDGELPPVDQLPPVPDWLHRLITPNGNVPAAPVGEVIPHGEQHKTLVSIAGSMRRRGLGADEIEAALLVTNATRLEVPAPNADIRRIAESVVKLYKPGELVNGVLHVPRLPEDAQAAADQLAELLDLPSVDVKIKAARVFGKGSGAQVEIDLSNGETMTFSALREMMRPQTLIAEVAACAGARPVLKQIQCAEALTLTKVLAQFVPTDTENDVAREWGRDYLELAETIDLNMSDQTERWGAFERLSHRNPGSHSHDNGIELATAGIVLRHTDGTQFVRTLWFERYVKTRDASVSRIAVSARMARVGWERRGRHGDIKATAPARRGTRIYPFWIVPAGWMAEQEAGV